MNESQKMMELVEELLVAVDTRTFLHPLTRGNIIENTKIKLQAIADSLDWISVADRLPTKEEAENLLLVVSEEEKIAWYEHNVDRWATLDSYKYITVTHWRPFPELPKVKNETT